MARLDLSFKEGLNLPIIHSASISGMLSTRNMPTNRATSKNLIIKLPFIIKLFHYILTIFKNKSNIKMNFGHIKVLFL